MQNFTFDFQNIIDGGGIGISLTGMLIVFSALFFLSAFFSLLPKVLKKLEKKFPRILDEGLEHNGNNRVDKKADNRIIAAIGFVLHQNQKR